MMIQTEEANQSMNSRTVYASVILSLVTLGIYIPYWFLMNRIWINQLGKDEEKLSLATPIISLILYSIVAFSFIPVTLLLSGIPFAFFQYIDLVISYLVIALTLYLSFQVRVILKQYIPKHDISLILTLLFHVWYLQYKINKHLNEFHNYPQQLH